MKVLLLGASGLLGHNVLQRLVAEGHQVRALVRRADSICLIPCDVDIRIGSPLDQATLAAAAEGCDAVVNCTGITDMSLLHREDYMPVNRDLCRMLVGLLETHGISILVHTSSVNTIGHGSPARSADEDEPMRPPFTDSWYADSKLQGERIVLDAARQHPARHIIVVNAGFMVGPWDVKPSSGRLLLAGYRRRLMVAPSGGKSFVYVGDVAQAIVNALTMGRSGQRYIAVNSTECHSIKDLYRMQAQVMGYRQKVLVLPDLLLQVAGSMGDALRALGIRTELSTRNVRQLMVGEYYTADRAVADLHMPQTPLPEAIRQFHRWRVTKT